ncbi:MAG: hypothetical protein H0V56_00320 [Chthoniobacterales bacterium]|nr:hypothetical protein [Chthoniobacterales bacterium]
MLHLSPHRTLACLSLLSFLLGSSAFAQLDRALEAHGGVTKWKSFGSVEFDQTWTSAKGLKKDHQLFDLRSRDGLITSAAYTLGARGGEVWIKPALDALGGTPPRFYMWTPFYFFGMPFVFADPGVVQESLGKKTFQGQEFDAVKVTFKKGTGDSSDDFYTAYLDPKSGQMKLVSYVVTYAALRKDKPMDQLEPHALVFEEWQDANGLRVPKRGKFYNWKNESIEGEPLGVMEFSNVNFSEKAPEAAKFAKPADAVIAPL